MRKITQQAVNAFMNGKNFKLGNTEVINTNDNLVIMKLHGNTIALSLGEGKKGVIISTCGWNTQTTLDRLNGFPNVSIKKKKGQIFLNGKEWDGHDIVVNY